MTLEPQPSPQPVSFTTPLSELETPTAVEFLDGVIGVLARTSADTVTLWTTDRVDPEKLKIQDEMDLGDAVSALRRKPSVRAFALPPGQVRDDSLNGIYWLRFLTVALGAILSGSPWIFQIYALMEPAAFISWNVVGVLGVLLIALGILHPTFRRGFANKAYALDDGRQVLLTELLSAIPSTSRAEVVVNRVKTEYGKLVSDICYRIEYPALFDVAVPQTQVFTRAMIAWENAEKLTASEVTALAAHIRESFEAAKRHAETVGMDHLGDSRGQAETALKLMRVATSRSGTEAERSAALKKASEILGSLMLYYLPTPQEARALVSGQSPKALPGRWSDAE